jgi:omega-hydroxy-beta-dihydromenaquinone-9 sulfotransferase
MTVARRTTNDPPMTTASNSPKRPREWMPRIWEGCDFFAWLRLLTKNHFAVGPRQIYIAVIITFVSGVHMILRLLQDALYGSEIRQTPIREAPIFILGHWRTGTTLLHELLILDERHTFPSTYACFVPNHFVLTESTLAPLLRFLLPSRRPMDNMAAGWDRPQEDEFALCMMGQPSPYLTIAFPNRPPQGQEALDLESMPPSARQSWKRTFLRLLRSITYRNPKRLVLKSPTHTFRIRSLLELFPEARFIHIVRDPHVVFPSTVNLWQTLYETHGLQTPTFAGLEEQVFATFLRMYRKLDETRSLVDPSRFHELRYEDLVRAPVEEMRKLYDHLGLGDFDLVRLKLESYFAAQREYRTNRYAQPLEVRAKIAARWGEVIRRYGYA